MAEVAAASAQPATDPQVEFLFDNEGREGTQAPPPPPVAPVAPAAPVEEEEIINSDDFFKTNFGWESADAGKRELEELRKLKSAPPQTALTFANETSEKIFNYLKEGKEEDVYDYLDRKRKLSAVDKMPGADAIKLHIQQANPHYKAEDIQDVFEERYTLPEKPLSAGDDTDPEYLAAVSKWQQGVDRINRRIERDAFTARGELAKLHTQLVLPDIAKVDPKAEAAKNEFDQQIQAARSSYLAALEADGTKFSGFNAEYKDNEVTIPVSYTITPEEQQAFKSKIQEFDIDAYFLNRWWPDGKADVPKLMEDLYLLENKTNVFQKMVKDSARKMQDHRIKLQNNINVSGTGNNQPYQAPAGDSKEKEKSEVDHLWANA